jgi:hypothetical protein
MGAHRAEIAFPPAHVSLKGLMMTNPGHIDPGYEGPLHCTVINMGHESYSLNRGDRIMRVLVFELDNKNQVAPNLVGVPAGPNPQITTELLTRLSIDFLDVEKRAESIAKKALHDATYRATLISAGIPVALAIAGWITVSVFSPLEGIKGDLVKLRSDVNAAASKLDEKQDVLALETKLKQEVNALETKLTALRAEAVRETKLEERLSGIEARLNALTPALPPTARPQQ